MQASNLEYYLKKRKEEKEYREDLKELIYYASTELGITTIRISFLKILLAIIIMILVVIMLKNNLCLTTSPKVRLPPLP